MIRYICLMIIVLIPYTYAYMSYALCHLYHVANFILNITTAGIWQSERRQKTFILAKSKTKEEKEHMKFTMFTNCEQCEKKQDVQGKSNIQLLRLTIERIFCCFYSLRMMIILLVWFLFVICACVCTEPFMFTLLANADVTPFKQNELRNRLALLQFLSHTIHPWYIINWKLKQKYWTQIDILIRIYLLYADVYIICTTYVCHQSIP